MYAVDSADFLSLHKQLFASWTSRQDTKIDKLDSISECRFSFIRKFVWNSNALRKIVEH